MMSGGGRSRTGLMKVFKLEDDMDLDLEIEQEYSDQEIAQLEKEIESLKNDLHKLKKEVSTY